MSWSPFLLLFAATLLIELGLIEALRRFWPPGPRRVDVLCVNAFTHPLAYTAVSLLGAPFLPVESLVVLAEALAYRWLNPPLSWSRALAYALTANAITAALSWLT